MAGCYPYRVKVLPESIDAPPDRFESTHWSVVLAAGRADDVSAQARAALSRLCQTYWTPLYGFVRGRGYSVHDAEDLTQGFFVHLIHARAGREQGKFRSFLLASLKNFPIACGNVTTPPCAPHSARPWAARRKFSPAEKAAIDTRPTLNLDAYDLYLKAKQLVDTYPQTADWRATLLEAVRLLDDATARDGRFALAYCLAAKAHGALYHTGLDPTPARPAQQERATATAVRLQPDLGEAHLAHALWIYRSEHHYADARTELAAARAALPNNAEVLLLLSFMDRREGRWPEARHNQEKATALDPSNYTLLTEQLVLYDRMRRYAEEIRTADAGIVRLPSSADYFRLMKAEIFLEAGQSQAARALLATLPAGYDPNGAATITHPPRGKLQAVDTSKEARTPPHRGKHFITHPPGGANDVSKDGPRVSSPAPPAITHPGG